MRKESIIHLSQTIPGTHLINRPPKKDMHLMVRAGLAENLDKKNGKHHIPDAMLLHLPNPN